jgi:importin subunit beta-1
MDALAPFMMMGLNNFEAYHVCVIAVGLVGDIARNIETKIQPYCDEIMTALINSLQNTTLHRSVKPPVLSCFGDIAMAIGIKYEPYIQISLMMLLQASQTRAPEHDEELIEYVNQLREGILEAYTGIIQGLKDGKRVELLLPYNEAIMDFLEMLSNDENRDYEVMSKAAGLIGDIASSLGPSVRQYLEKPFIEIPLKEAYSSGDESVMETCNWAKSEVQTLLRAVPAI